MNNPEWMKPHLRARLEQERKEATRTGPVNGEKALVCDNGKVKEVITNHKPAPAKADFNVGDTSTWMHNGKPTRGTIKSVGPAQGIKTPIEVEFPDGTTEHYLVNPLPHCENSDYSKAPKNGLVRIGCKATAIDPPAKRFSWAELENAFRPRQAELRSVSYRQIKQWLAECKE